MGKSKSKKSKNKHNDKENFVEYNVNGKVDSNLNNIDKSEKGNNEEIINENINKEENIDNISQKPKSSNVNNDNNLNNIDKNEDDKQIKVANDTNVLNNVDKKEEETDKQIEIINDENILNNADKKEKEDNKQIEIDNVNKELNIQYDEEQQAIINLRKKYLNLTSENQNSNLPTTLYCIIACSENSIIQKSNFEISTAKNDNIETQNEELIEVYVYKANKLKFHEYNNSFQQKNIYLYKAELKNVVNNENIKIKLTLEGSHLISKEKFNIQKNQQLFIYSISFNFVKFIGKINFWNNKLRGFIDNTYNIPYIQKFLIYKDIVKLSKNEHLLDCLLIESLSDIYNIEKISFEFYLIFLSMIIKDTKNYDKLSENFKEIMYLLIMNLSNIKEITFKKYDNDVYSKTINKLEEFNLNFNNNKFNLWLNLFLLIYN